MASTKPTAIPTEMDLNHINYPEKLHLLKVAHKNLNHYYPPGLIIEDNPIEGSRPLGSIAPLIQFTRDDPDSSESTGDAMHVSLQGTFPSNTSLVPLIYGSEPFSL